MYIGKTYHFDAAHYIPGHEKCGKTHGHTWTLEVMVEGVVDKHSSMVLDFHTLNTFVEEVISFLDHKTLNEVLPFVPTAENIASYLQESLQRILSVCHNKVFSYKKVYIRLQEGQGGYADTRKLT